MEHNISLRAGFKYLTLLTAVIVTFYIVTAIVQNRLVVIGNFDLSAAIFVYPFSYLICDVMTEVYGYKVARQVLWCSLLSWILSGVLIISVINLPTPGYWSSYSEQFDTVMAPYLRTIVSGIVAVVAGQFLNIYAISKLKILTNGRFFWIRSVSSCFSGDAITTTLALTFIFAGRLSFDKIAVMITSQIVIAMILQGFFALPAGILVRFLKKLEKIDAYDINVNFNPFKFNIDNESKKPPTHITTEIKNVSNLSDVKIS